MTPRFTRNTARMLVPPSAPAMNGLLAMPTSDALVSTPKPAPCARGGITLPAALYDAVIAAPIPAPTSVDATHMTHTRPDELSRPEPHPATTAPPAITTREAKRCRSL